MYQGLITVLTALLLSATPALALYSTLIGNVGQGFSGGPTQRYGHLGTASFEIYTGGGAYEYSQCPYYGGGGTVKNFYTYVHTPNTRVDVTPYTFYKNGGSTSLAVSIGAGETDTWKSDTSNTVSLSNGDDFAGSITPGGGGPAALTMRGTSFQLEDSAMPMDCILNAADDLDPTNGTSGHMSLVGELGAFTTVDAVEFKIRAAGWAHHFYGNTANNASTRTGTFTLYKNGSSTPLTFTLGDNASNVDSANRVRFESGDTVNLHASIDAGGGNKLSLTSFGINFTSDTPMCDLGAHSTEPLTTSTTTLYGSILGRPPSTYFGATEAEKAINVPFDTYVGRMRVRYLASAGTAVLTLRDDGSDTALTLNLASTGGAYTWAESGCGTTVAVTANSKINYELVTTGFTGTIATTGITLNNQFDPCGVDGGHVFVAE